MVLSGWRTPAFVVPDTAAWAVWGEDVEGQGFDPVGAPEQAEVVLAPERLPAPLVAALREAWERVPEPRRLLRLPAELEGVPVDEALHPAGHGEHHHEHHGGHDHGEHHGGHDHGDMMAIEGEPSRDGLIMEPLDFELGPLGSPLAGGLVVELSLDGDLVASARPRATLERDAGLVPDPLSPAAWRTAMAVARGRALTAADVAEIEVERAISHAASVRALARTVGWAELSDRATRVVHDLVDETRLDEAQAAAAELRRLVDDSHRLRRRLGGRAVVSADALAERHVGGPVARAAGLAADTRSSDPIYERLGFEPELRTAGDAMARTELRVAEIVASLELVSRARARGFDNETEPRMPAVVEGPRGPLHAVAAPDGAIACAAPGSEALPEIAGTAVEGLEVGTAIAALGSFDLSPWRMPA